MDRVKTKHQRVTFQELERSREERIAALRATRQAAQLDRLTNRLHDLIARLEAEEVRT